MSDNLFSKTLIQFLSSQIVFFVKKNTVLKNLLIINIMLLKLKLIINNVNIKLIVIILND